MCYQFVAVTEFVMEVNERIEAIHAELRRVMNSPTGTASEQDALLGAIAELKTALIEYGMWTSARRPCQGVRLGDRTPLVSSTGGS